MGFYICVGCGKSVDFKDVRGSMKHPYCKPCFKKRWDDDYDAYLKWLEMTHG